MTVQYYEGIGRRKESIARVRLMSGTGNFVVNGKKLEEYFNRLGDPQTVVAPLDAAGENRAALDITVTVEGGGVSGQAKAVQLGMARAVSKMNPQYHSAMRKGGFLTRDARIKERKKHGLKRARKAPTYTKR